MDVDSTRAACHEAGHVVIALHFGLPIRDAYADDRKPRVEAVFDWQNKVEEGLTVFAGGAASETIKYSGYDKEGCTQDVADFDKHRVSGTFEDYIETAKGIINQHTEQHKKIMLVLLSAMSSAGWDEPSDGSPLASSGDLYEAWNA